MKLDFKLAEAYRDTTTELDGVISALGGKYFGPKTIVTYSNGDVVEYEIEGELGQNSIQNKSNAVKVEIGIKATIIGNNAFFACSKLSSVTIPNSITNIGNYAFSNCSKLSSVTIPNSITNIGNYAFNGCSGLTSVTIPDGVTSIGAMAFSSCSGLISLSVSVGNTVYDSRNGCNAIIKTTNNILVVGCKNTIIPDNITSIEYAAFYDCSNLTSISIPDSVTLIGNSAFSGCSGLSSVTIGNGVTRILESVFYKCSSLTSITIPSNVASLGNLSFSYCPATVTFEGKDKATVQGMRNFRWSIGTNKIICTDGTL